MPVFACRWPNGDVSFVAASSKEVAVEQLDEVGDASCVKLRVAPGFMVHFNLGETGLIELEGFGEETDNFLDELYPVLYSVRMEAALSDVGDPPPEVILAAVKAEKTRIKNKPGPQPKTELGRRIRKMSGMPASMIDRIVEDTAKEMLENINPNKKH
jgi:hypothetical protein